MAWVADRGDFDVVKMRIFNEEGACVCGCGCGLACVGGRSAVICMSLLIIIYPSPIHTHTHTEFVSPQFLYKFVRVPIARPGFCYRCACDAAD